MSGAAALRSWSVGSTWFPEHVEIVVARSRGAAKYRLWTRMQDAWSELPFTSMRATAVGGFHESDRFRSFAEYRGIPFARVGMRVRSDDGKEGVIVGHNDSANLDVIFDGGDMVLNCHPAWQISYLVGEEWLRSTLVGS